jgi:phage tail sheath protein FI
MESQLMATYKTPGVYIEEISTLPPSIAAVETAIPAFIGYTEKILDANGIPLTSRPSKPVRITSLLEYQQFFGGARAQVLDVNVVETIADPVNEVDANIDVNITTVLGPPTEFLYYSMQLFFANGGGPCYVISIGDYLDVDTGVVQSHFLGSTTDTPPRPSVFTILEAYDEPTLLVFPDACLFQSDPTQSDPTQSADAKHGDVVENAGSVRHHRRARCHRHRHQHQRPGDDQLPW